MDLEQIFLRTFQYSPRTYCIVKKPHLSFDLNVNHFFKSTNVNLDSTVYQPQKDDKWQKCFKLDVIDSTLPTFSLYFVPFSNYSLGISDRHYRFILSPKRYSMFFKFRHPIETTYGITYISDKSHSIIGSFDITDTIQFSARLCDECIKIFYKLSIDYRSYFFFGLSLTKVRPLSDSLSEIFGGTQFPLFKSQYLVGFGISDNLEFSISRRKNNHRLTYIFRNAPSLSGPYYENFHYLQYKIADLKGNKIAAFYDFTDKKLYTRVSLVFNRNLSLKFSAKYKKSWCEPTFGVKFYFDDF